MFRFLTPKPSDRAHPLQTQKAASVWFRQLPAVDAIGRQLQVIRALEELSQSTAPADYECLAAIAYLDTELGPDRAQLLAQYVDRVCVSPTVAERIWQAAYDISQAFIAAYRRLLDDALEPSADNRLKRAIAPITSRLIHYLDADARLRVLKSERWIPQKWVELHRLYRRAAELSIERTLPEEDTPGLAGARRTIEQEYIAVLLTHLVNTGTLMPAQVEWVLERVHAWGGALKLEKAPSASCAFAVDFAGRRGLVRHASGETSSSVRFLDTAPMGIEIEKALATLRHAGNGDGETAAATHWQRINVLEKLRAMLTPDTAPTVSREPRAAVSYEADVRTGLSRICAELAPRIEPISPLHAPVRGVEARTSGAVPGRRETPRGRDTQAARDFDDAPTWWVQNRSRSGLRISAVGGGRHALALGTLVAVRGRDGGDWALGVVRRLVRATTEKVDVGVSVIALRFAAVELHAKRQAREDMGFVVDGIDVSTIGERFSGLYLPPPSRPNKPLDVKSVVIPVSEYAAGRSIVAIAAQAVYTIVLRELIERHGDWCWAAIEITDRANRN